MCCLPDPLSLSQDTARAELSEDEDDPSELVRPVRSYLSESSSESENEVLQSIGKISKSETGGLSQKEILELIKQQSGKVDIRENQAFDQAGASTSKQSDFPVTVEERSSSSSKVIASDEPNDSDVPRGKNIFPNNNRPEVEPGKFPGPPSSPASTSSLKDSPLCTNQPEEVSPSKNSSCDMNSSLVTDNKVSASNQLENRSRSESRNSKGDESIAKRKSTLGTEAAEEIDESLACEFKDDPDIREDELKLLQAIQNAVTQCIDNHTDKPGGKVSGKILMHDDTNCDVGRSDVGTKLPESSDTIDGSKIFDYNTQKTFNENRDGVPSNSLEIVIDPNAPPDDDLFADVFSQQSPGASPHSKIHDNSSSERIDRSAIDDNAALSSSVKSQGAESTGFGLNACGKPMGTEDDDEDDDIFADVSQVEEEIRPTKNDKPNFWKVVNDMKKTSSNTELNNMMHQLEQESEKLACDTKREERLTSTITEQITQDAQVLLQLFGIPYIVAPMEAEAQCAYLDLTGQTDGTITEDSDIWLFGARNVYKNFFDQKKFVKQFKATDILQCYRLNRDDLIMIAMLVGSDYTVGLAGVGPVNAIEIVAHFPQVADASTPQQRLAKFVDAYLTSEMNHQLMRKLKSLEFFDGFPSDDVVKAYISPIVDESREKFTWAKPNLAEIRNFMRDKFGWDSRKTDQTLKPILDRWTQTTTQKTIHNYFEWAFDVEEVSAVSKRVGKAVEILTTGEIPNSPPPSKKPRQAEPKDRLQSSYSRRKYGRYQSSEKVDTEPVLEGSRAARAAAKAIMAATRKPVPKPAETTSTSNDNSTTRPGIPAVGRTRQNMNLQSSGISERESADGAPQAECIRPPRQIVKASPSASASSVAPIPSLSDILCGVGSEPSPWTPSKDFVSPYVKRKYGRMGQHSTSTKGEGQPVLPRRSEDLGRIMPSKTPAQIARERAAKKLKEAKAKALTKSRSKKSALDK
ncbi:XPGN [Nesidiocoris tenuis]|uniref:XPGN n=1 Tax=Nesidiocoris tenuis TaxID=355587 RepID=A0ABN7AAX9_9HEMI|nr:XPGN [Nesidiocoris tenuis]